MYDRIFNGDCLNLCDVLPDESIDLIMTSPPYADNRSHTYGGVKPNDYVSWFLPRSEQFFRVLKKDGSFILNIKEKVVSGERHTYVIELILALKEQGWLWTEEYLWCKKNCAPGKWPNRFRDSWERCLHFTKSKKFKMYQSEVKVPIGDWAKKRLKNLSDTDKIRDNSKVGSGFGKKVDNWVGRDLVYPTNVLHLSTETGNKEHSAVFPKELPSWFIRLFTQEGDVVLDPFIGSGTTAVAALELNRHYVGIEIRPEYIPKIEERLKKVKKKNDSARKS